MQGDETFRIYTKPEYEHALVQRVNKTKRGDRVAVMTTFFEPDTPSIRPVVEALCLAAERGAEVLFTIDAAPFLFNEAGAPGPLFFASKLPKLPDDISKRLRGHLRAFQRLRRAGAKCVIVNRPGRAFRNPARGRSHTKFAVINDYVFVGGCNLTAIEPLDLMVGWQDARTADWLYDVQQGIIGARSVRKALGGIDQQLSVSKDATLLLDAGVANQSLIFDKALQLIDSAKKYIFITCQVFPYGIAAHHLALAQQRGVNVQILYNSPKKHPLPLRLLQRYVIRSERQQRPSDFFSQELPVDHDFLHAKLLATDQGTLLGSHNYVHSIVRLGTAEIALLHKGPEFGERAIAKIRQQLSIL